MIDVQIATPDKGSSPMTRRLHATLAVGLALLACLTSRAYALDASEYCEQPPPSFGAQFFTIDAAPYIAAWHTGPASPDPPGHIPYNVYIGWYNTSLHTFTAWEQKYVTLSNGQWTEATYRSAFFDPAVAKYPELARYRPYGEAEYDLAFPPDAPLTFAPLDGWGDSCQ